MNILRTFRLPGAGKLAAPDQSMSIVLAIWRASFQATTNAWRRDARTRTGFMVALFVQVALSIWAITGLLPAFAAWQAGGTSVLQQHLWLTCFLAWLVIALFSALTTAQYGLGGNEALLLATQPIKPASRLRALYGLVLLKGCGNWLLGEAIVLGIALTPALDWRALSWLLVLLIGAALVAWLALVATLLVTRFVLPHLRLILGLSAGSGILLALAALVLHTNGWSLSPGSLALSIPLTPFLAIPLLLLCLALALLPLARPCGQLYLAAFLHTQSLGGATKALAIPGTRTLLALLARSRGMTAALLTRGVLSQSRHILAWLRLLSPAILAALFPLIRSALAPLHLASTLLVADYAALLVALLLLEYAPYAIGSEGNRFALYLVLPRGISTFLRARLYSFLIPSLLTGLLAVLVFGLWNGLSPLELGAALLLTLLILSGYIVFTVLGSALDEDLTIEIEGRTQALLQEEMPITPRRLQLFSLSIMLFAAMLLLSWKLPLLLVLPALFLFDGVLALLMWWLSLRYLERLTR